MFRLLIGFACDAELILLFGKLKRRQDDVDEQIGEMMSTLKDIVATKPEIKKPKILNAVQEDWTSYCYNFGMRVAALPEEDSRDKIRMGMEQLYFDEKQKK